VSVDMDGPVPDAVVTSHSYTCAHTVIEFV
jgi:hypothetical protein